MNLLKKAIVWAQFKLGIYEARQIMKIERGGVVISSTNSRYQPSSGIRYELSPNEWLFYSYLFFPRNYGKRFYDEEFTTRELYYDYFSEREPHRDVTTVTYAIFKNRHNTGYIIQVSYYSNRERFCSAKHISSWGFSKYPDTFENYVKPLYFATNEIQAAIYVLADAWDFKKCKVDLPSLIEDCSKSPGSCLLHSKLIKILQDCKHIDEYIAR